MPADDLAVRVKLGGAEYVFDPEEEVTIGRSEDARVRSGNLAVSRSHAVLSFVEGRWVFLDAGSRHGSYLAGRPVGRIDIAGPTTLRLGDPLHGEVLEITLERLEGVAPPHTAHSRSADSEELTGLFDRIIEDAHSPTDMERLRQAVHVVGDRRVVQVGKYNVPIQEGREIHIGDRIYQGAHADAIREVLRELAWGSGRGSLRGLGGAIMTIGMLISLVGGGMFFYGLISAIGDMGSGPDAPFGPPPVLLWGFGIAGAGVAVMIVGSLVTGWSHSSSRGKGG